MPLFAIGLNHKTAAVEVREGLSFSPSRLPPALQRLKSVPGVQEGTILSTCNRTEVYCVAQQLQGLKESLVSFLADFHQTPEERFLPHLYECSDEEAIQHLFEVACGLDSMILGESEVLSQVREAFQVAEAEGTVGPVLHSLFRQAVSCGKRARTETKIGEGGLSVASVAVQLARSIFGDLEGHLALVLGAGETSELTLKHLVHSGVSAVVVSNRTYERAVELAGRFQGAAIKFDAFPEFLPKADIVIASTSAPHFICDKQSVAAAMRQRKGKPLLIVDIAVPRDIDPAVNQLPDVFLYDIDDLDKVVQTNLKDRQVEIPKVKRIIAEAVSQFTLWLGSREALPLILSLQSKAEGLRLAEISRAVGKLDGLSAAERQAVEELSTRLVAKLLAGPLSAIRQFASEKDADHRLEIARELLGLGSEEHTRAEADSPYESPAKESRGDACVAHATADTDFPSESTAPEQEGEQ